MTNLKSVNAGMNRFCGPAVLSILTGRSTDECAAVISRINGQYNVSGVQLNDLLRAADKLGFDQQLVDNISGGSLYRALISIANQDGMYIITIKGHFIVIEVNEHKLYFCDNHTKEPIPAASSARLGMEVIAIHRVTKRHDAVIETHKPKPEYITIITYQCKECKSCGELPEDVIHYNTCSHS